MLKKQYKFTQGPWKILPEEVGKDYIRVRGTVPGTRHKICNVITPVYDGVSEREAQETRANAYLVEAAPRLLEALEEMFKPVPMGKNPKAVWYQRNQAAKDLLDELKPKLS